MIKVKILVAMILFLAMEHLSNKAYERVTTTKVEDFMKANIEALTYGESDMSEWIWEEDWVSCEIGGFITIHQNSAGYTAGDYAFSPALKAQLDLQKVSYSYFPSKRGKESHCVAGWRACTPKPCQIY